MEQKDILIQKLMDRIAGLEKLVRQQSARIAELEKRLTKNSSNSSKPPSSDGLSKPPKTNSLRQKGKNKSGGQPGHKGHTLKQVPTPDKIEFHKLSRCPLCFVSLTSVQPLGILKRQVFDMPVPKVEVTEHQAEIKVCPCCNKQVIAAFPFKVNAPAQYGEVIQSYSLYFQYQQFIPEDRLQEAFSDLFGINLATATLNRFSKSAHEQLEDFDRDALSKIQAALVKNLDETGFRITGNTQWLHVASTNRYTYYHVSPKRKSLLEGLKGIVVHDHWKPYYLLPNVLHALCNQHHLRELKALIEYEKEVWAKKMRRFLQFGLHYRHIYLEQIIPDLKVNRLIKLYDKIVDEGISYHECLPAFSEKKGRGRKARRIGHNLALRLKNHRDDVLRFLTNPHVPFTNNQAERDIRMMKCKQKISGGFRSVEGAEIFARMRGFISTARKQGWNVLESIQQIVRGHVPILT
jgi:transposase